MVATVDVRCTFQPYDIHFSSGVSIPGRKRIGQLQPVTVEVAGFGSREDCKSEVQVGKSYLMFLTNVSGQP